MSSSSQAPEPSLTDIFSEFLTAFERGEPVDLEEVCARYPVHADQLRQLHRDWQLIQDLLGDRDRAVATLRDNILGERACGGEVDFGSRVLKRLAGRSAAHERYIIKDEVARGGQGVVLQVWDDDLSRELAMKVMLDRCELHSGKATPVDSRSLGRFLEEARVTGQLDHPGIVPIHELGLDELGRVFFTMKLVKGRDLRTVLELSSSAEEGWTQPRVLGVLLKVCEAMAFAHSKGVIHRDLKPSNVMVGEFGEVYVMDWGLARILGQLDAKDVRIRPIPDSGEGSASGSSAPVTMDGAVVGTPAYMSPEQAAGQRDEVGPQTDVYAIGAMLYHLLAGRAPYQASAGRMGNYAVLLQVQGGPPDPLHGVARDAPAELVAICEKAMARERQDRYPGVGGLADDLRAYLEHRVVSAYEVGPWAEARKWVVRNRRFAISSAAALLIALLSTVAIAWIQAANAEREHDLNDALVAETQAAVAALARAETEAARANRERDVSDRVAGFLVDLFHAPDPAVARGKVESAREILDRGAERIRAELEETQVRGRLLKAMAEAYQGLGVFDRAEALYLEAHASMLDDPEVDRREALDCLYELGSMYAQQDRLQEAEGVSLECLEAQREVLGPEHADTLATEAGLGRIHFLLGDVERSEQELVHALERQRAVLGDNHATTLDTIGSLGVLYWETGRLGEAEPLLRECAMRMESIELFGPTDPRTLTARNNLGALYTDMLRFEDARAILLDVLQARRLILPEDHPHTLITLQNLGTLYWATGQLSQAEDIYAEAFDRARDIFGPTHMGTLLILNNLATTYMKQGAWGEAETLLQECLEAMDSSGMAERHPYRLQAIENLVQVYVSTERWEEAEPLARDLLERTTPDAPGRPWREQLLERARAALEKQEES